jgi:hypothetical protein
VRAAGSSRFRPRNPGFPAVMPENRMAYRCAHWFSLKFSIWYTGARLSGNLLPPHNFSAQGIVSIMTGRRGNIWPPLRPIMKKKQALRTSHADTLGAAGLRENNMELT